MSESSGFVISESFGASWELFKKKWHMVYGLYLIPVVIGVLYAAITNMLGEEMDIVQMFIFFLYMIVQMVVSMGLIQGYLNLIRGKDVSMQTFTDRMPQAVNYFLGTLLMSAIIIGGLLLLVIPGIYLMMKYYFVPFLLVDKKLSPTEALKMSAQMTDGIKLEMLGLLFASLIVTYMGIFALFFGIFITAPVAGLSYVYFYEKALKRIGE